MKLAEALSLRADMQTKIDGLQQRVLRNVKVQDGESPHEDPKELLRSMRGLYDEQCKLIQQINARNNDTRMPDGESMADALARRESLLKKRNALAAIVARATEPDMRLTHSEIKTRVTISVAELQKEVDALSQAYRELDTQIQGMNWTVDL